LRRIRAAQPIRVAGRFLCAPVFDVFHSAGAENPQGPGSPDIRKDAQEQTDSCRSHFPSV
jgi:hypothetical protein